MMSRPRALGLTGITLAALLVGIPAHAQFNLPGTSADLAISLDPVHPAPREHVHLSAHSSALDLSQSSIVWRANGNSIGQGIGVTSADISAGDLGAETDITVEAVAPDGGGAAAEATIIPTEIDLLFDSNSYVPPFYRGRALPGAGVNLSLEAITRFKRPAGALVSPSDITYTWKRNNEVIGAVSGRGKSSVVIPAPALFGTDTISVDAISNDGILSGAAAVRIPSIDPVLILYEDHPLFGVMYNQALGPSAFVGESEMTFAAVPYFAQAVSRGDPLLQYVWRVNDAAIAADPKNPSEITISADKSSGTADVALEVTHATNVFLDSRGEWGITFTSPAAQDQFSAPSQ